MDVANLPALPLVRFGADAEYLDEALNMYVQRYDGTPVAKVTHRADVPDTIIMNIMAPGHLGSFTVYLTPAMLVHMANTQLTNEERAFINVPVAAERT